MSLVIYGLKGVHTHTRMHARMKKISRNQAQVEASVRWFKKFLLKEIYR